MRILRLFVVCAGIFWTLPVLAQPATGQGIDRSPHKELFVKVNDVRLEYLDWGGSGETLLFLPGLGNTAHIFDDIAPEFANRFHVLGLTRRGFGRSDHPATGYDRATLIEDLHQFLDALGINRVILVGHSFAGVELNGFAEELPDRVDKLVYLDCAYSYDQPGTVELLGQLDSLMPHRTAADSASFSALDQWFRSIRPGWNDACEADLRETRLMTPQGISGHGSTPDFVDDALVKVAVTSPWDYSKLKSPVLAFFADHRIDKLLADASDADRQNVEAIVKSVREWRRKQIELFKSEAKNAQVVELPDTDHFCFIQRQDDVVRQMRLFLPG